eukprot:1175058-Amphidinium_carterae.1
MASRPILGTSSVYVNSSSCICKVMRGSCGWVAAREVLMALRPPPFSWGRGISLRIALPRWLTMLDDGPPPPHRHNTSSGLADGSPAVGTITGPGCIGPCCCSTF